MSLDVTNIILNNLQIFIKSRLPKCTTLSANVGSCFDCLSFGTNALVDFGSAHVVTYGEFFGFLNFFVYRAFSRFHLYFLCNKYSTIVRSSRNRNRKRKLHLERNSPKYLTFQLIFLAENWNEDLELNQL